MIGPSLHVFTSSKSLIMLVLDGNMFGGLLCPLSFSSSKGNDVILYKKKMFVFSFFPIVICLMVSPSSFSTLILVQFMCIYHVFQGRQIP